MACASRLYQLRYTDAMASPPPPPLSPSTAARLQALLASVPDHRVATLRMPNPLPVPGAEEAEERVEGGQPRE